MFRFVILAAFLATAATAVNVGSPCVSGGRFPISLEIEGCVAAPCALPQLEDAIIKVKFIASQNSETLRASLHAFVLGVISIPFDLGDDAQACSGLANASCPVKKGQDLDYVLKLPIDAIFPVGATMFVEISVHDDSGSPAFCARVPVVFVQSRH